MWRATGDGDIHIRPTDGVFLAKLRVGTTALHSTSLGEQDWAQEIGESELYLAFILDQFHKRLSIGEGDAILSKSRCTASY